MSEDTNSEYNHLLWKEKVYVAWSRNKETLLKSSSGGIFFEAATNILAEGGLVCGAVYTDDYYGVKHILTDKIQDVKKMQGSKYSQSAMGNCFSEIKTALESGKKVLFTGTPCSVAACQYFLKKKHDKLYTISLICHGPVVPKILKEFIKLLENKHEAKICDFTMRYKKNGKILPLYYQAKFINGVIETDTFYNSLYGEIFASNIAMPNFCYNCKFKQQPYIGDIIIGDFKGIEYTNLPYNKRGVSAVIINNVRGMNFWNSISSQIEFYESSLKVVQKYNKRLRSSIQKPENDKIKIFWNKFEQEGIESVYYLVHQKQTLFQKVKMLLKIFVIQMMFTIRRRKKNDI